MKPRKNSRLVLRRMKVVGAMILSAAAGKALATNYTWTATGPNPDWSAESFNNITHVYTTNWGISSSPILPPSAPSTSIEFSSFGGGLTIQDISNPFALNSLTFDSGAASFSIGGNPSNFVANGATLPSINQNSSNAQSLSSLEFGANLTLNDNNGDLNLIAALTGGTNGIYKFGSGTTTLSGGSTASPSTFSFLHDAAGPLNISGGAVTLSATGSTGFGGESSLFVEANATVTIEGGAQLTTYATPQVHNNGLIEVVGNGTVWSAHDAPNGGPAADIRIGYAGSTSTLAVVGFGRLVDDGNLTVGNTSTNGVGDLEVHGESSVSIGRTLILNGTSIVNVVDASITAGALSSPIGSSPTITIENENGHIALTVGTANTDSTFGGVIKNGVKIGSFVKVGSGTLTLSGANTYTGGTTIAGGWLREGIDSALASGTSLTITGGGLDLNGHNQTLGSVTFGDGSNPGSASFISTGSGTLTIKGSLSFTASTNAPAPAIFTGNIGIGSPTLTINSGLNYANALNTHYGSIFAGPITGSGNVDFEGAGHAVLDVTSSYTGSTTIGDTVSFASANALPSNTDLTVNGSLNSYIANAETWNGIILAATSYDQTVGSLSGSGSIHLSAAALTIGANNNSSTFSGSIFGSNGGKIIKTGNGILTLTGVNSYTGGTRIDSGWIAVSTDGNLGSASAPLTFNGGNLWTQASFSSSRPIAANVDGVVDLDSHTVTFAGKLSGTGGLTAVTNGTLLFTGSGSALGNLSAGVYGSPANVILDGSSGGSLTLSDTGSTGFGGESSLFVEDQSTLTVKNGFVLNTVDTPQMHNNSTMIVDGASTTWNNTPASQFDFAQIRVGYAGGTSKLTVQNSATVNTQYMLVSEGGNNGIGNLNVTSGGTVNVANQLNLSDYAAITVDGGTLNVGSLSDGYTKNNGSASSSIMLSDPAGSSALVFSGNEFSAYFGAITDGPHGPGGITFNGPFQVLYNATYSGPTIVNSGHLELDTQTHTGSFTVNGGLLVLGNAIISPGLHSLTANTGATIDYNASTINGGFLRGAGTHSMDNDVVNGSTFMPGTTVAVSYSPSTFSNVTSSAFVNVNNFAHLTWDGGLQTAAGVLNVSSGTSASIDQFENDGSIHVYANASLDNTQTNLVNGGGASMQIDAKGIVNLHGTAIDLHGAELINDGTITGGTTNIYFNSLAKGKGSFGAINLLSGGTFSPGDSPGSATSGNLSWNAGGTYLFELESATGTAGTDWDVLHITGNLSLTGTQANPMLVDFMPLNPSAFDINQDYQWLIADVTGTISGFNSNDFVVENPTGLAREDGFYKVEQQGSGIYLVYDPINVPEPTGMGIITLGMISLSRRKRRIAG